MGKAMEGSQGKGPMGKAISAAFDVVPVNLNFADVFHCFLFCKFKHSNKGG